MLLTNLLKEANKNNFLNTFDLVFSMLNHPNISIDIEDFDKKEKAYSSYRIQLRDTTHQFNFCQLPILNHAAVRLAVLLFLDKLPSFKTFLEINLKNTHHNRLNDTVPIMYIDAFIFEVSFCCENKEDVTNESLETIQKSIDAFEIISKHFIANYDFLKSTLTKNALFNALNLLNTRIEQTGSFIFLKGKSTEDTTATATRFLSSMYGFTIPYPKFPLGGIEKNSLVVIREQRDVEDGATWHIVDLDGHDKMIYFTMSDLNKIFDHLLVFPNNTKVRVYEHQVAGNILAQLVAVATNDDKHSPILFQIYDHYGDTIFSREVTDNWPGFLETLCVAATDQPDEVQV